jgi:ATP-dependent Clp protease ATP-binding subunit ClpB
VRRRPYAVILFDEVEKAHADVWNVLLQVLDDGRLTDGQGRTVDFKNTVIILTSNIGSQHIQAIEELSGVPDVERKTMIHRAVTEDVRKAFRPEFVNRLDEIVVFQRLTRDDIRKIVDIQMTQFARRLARRDLSIDLTDRAKDVLGDLGFDPQYGARPLKRAIQKNVEDPLAKRVLGGDFPPGTTIRVDAGGVGGLKLEAKVQN